jgi:hypothetical protein
MGCKEKFYTGAQLEIVHYTEGIQICEKQILNPTVLY